MGHVGACAPDWIGMEHIEAIETGAHRQVRVSDWGQGGRLLSVADAEEHRQVTAALAAPGAREIGMALLDLPGVEFNRNGDYQLPCGNYVHRLADADLVEQDALGRLAAARDIRARKADEADATRDEWANALCGTNYGAIDCVESRIFVDRAVAHAESKNG